MGYVFLSGPLSLKLVVSGFEIQTKTFQISFFSISEYSDSLKLTPADFFFIFLGRVGQPPTDTDTR